MLLSSSIRRAAVGLAVVGLATFGIARVGLPSAGASVPPPAPDRQTSSLAAVGGYQIWAEISRPWASMGLDVADCQTRDGADVRIWNWVAGSPCQHWDVKAVGGQPGLYTIADGNTGKLLSVTDCLTEERATVDLHSDRGANCQKWRIESIDGTDVYKVIGYGSGLSLDVAGGDQTSGADVIIWPFHGGSNQRWHFQK